MLAIAFLLHCFSIIQGRTVPDWTELIFGTLALQKSHLPIKTIRREGNKWKVLFDPANLKKVGNETDPFVDLNDARERTQSWLVAMNNLSPAALSTLKRELDKRVDSAIFKSEFYLRDDF